VLAKFESDRRRRRRDPRSTGDRIDPRATSLGHRNTGCMFEQRRTKVELNAQHISVTRWMGLAWKRSLCETAKRRCSLASRATGIQRQPAGVAIRDLFPSVNETLARGAEEAGPLRLARGVPDTAAGVTLSQMRKGEMLIAEMQKDSFEKNDSIS